MSLEAAFAELGVDEPKAWADSQRNEGIDQLSCATVLRAFADVANRAPQIWDNLAEARNVPAPLAESLARINALGIKEEDLHRVLKGVASDMLFDVCSLLDMAAIPEVNPGEVMFGAFAVKEVEGDLVPNNEGLSLHESWNEVAATVLGEDVVTA